MPTKKKIVPTKEEKDAANDLQAPKKSDRIEKKSLFKSARKLAESGIKPDDGTSLEYFHPEDYFENGSADGETSKMFVITNAIKMKGKYGWLVRLTLVEEDESMGWVSLSLGDDDNPVEERQRLVNYFKTNTQPIGPCVFVALPSQYGKPFMSIQEAIPF